MKNKLSVVLATKNEEKNIGPCLESVKDIADEIVIFDEFSQDKTREIARKYNARIYMYQHKTNFHETKQKAIEKAEGSWILQLDADERVTPALKEEIREIINCDDDNLATEIFERKCKKEFKKYKLFQKHQKIIDKRHGKLGKDTQNLVAFFIPRKNYFLGKPLLHAGVYPDGVIRLIKKGKARLPGKSVHEIMEVYGRVGWLFSDLEHHESPTFSRYLERMNRYTDITANTLKIKNVPKNFWSLFRYSFLIPISYFVLLYIRHKGFLDGTRGFIWSLFSSLHYSVSYFKYCQL